MYVHFGKSPYGTCDVVPELFYVVTQFWQLDLIPLVPVESHLVLLRGGKKFRTIRMPLNVKSILLAWARVATFAGFAGTAVSAAIAYGDHGDTHAAFTQGVIAGCCGLLYAFLMLYPRLRMPGYERACVLAHIAGLDDTGWAALNVLYGRDPFDRPVKPGETMPMR